VKPWLAPAHLALTLVIVVWNVFLAGRIAQLRAASRPFALITGFAGLMMVPAFIVAIASTNVVTGRAIAAVDWLWPLTIVLCAVQATWALSRRLVNPLWGLPIAAYDILLAFAAVTRFAVAHGGDVPRPLLVLMAAQVDSLALITTDAAIVSPLFLHVPLISPAFPPLSQMTQGLRAVMATAALVWFGLLLAEIPRADVALDSYDDHRGDRLTERPAGFSIGLKLFPDIKRPPSSASVKSDFMMVDWTGVNAVNVVIVPGASSLAIDSVANAVAALPRDSLTVIATIGYHDKVLPELGKQPIDAETRLRTLRRVLERIRPDIVVPVQDPYGVGARMVGRLPPAEWQGYYARAHALVKQVRPRTSVALSISAFDTRDSTMYAWAVRPDAPIDLIGFSFYPTRLGARSMDAGFRAADRWMRANKPEKPHWVLGAGGYPLAHGEVSQERAIWAALSWATARESVKGLVVSDANDYGQAMGIRAPNGRFRRAADAMRTAQRTLGETLLPPGGRSTTDRN
jgi:hypothetical protein